MSLDESLASTEEWHDLTEEPSPPNRHFFSCRDYPADTSSGRPRALASHCCDASRFRPSQLRGREILVESVDDGADFVIIWSAASLDRKSQFEN